MGLEKYLWYLVTSEIPGIGIFDVYHIEFTDITFSTVENLETLSR